MVVALTPAKSEKKKKRRFTFISSVKDELKKVSWTSRKELKKSTKVVVGSIFFFGLSIYVVDLCIRGALSGFLDVVKRLIG